MVTQQTDNYCKQLGMFDILLYTLTLSTKHKKYVNLQYFLREEQKRKKVKYFGKRTVI